MEQHIRSTCQNFPRDCKLCEVLIYPNSHHNCLLVPLCESDKHDILEWRRENSNDLVAKATQGNTLSQSLKHGWAP